MWQPAHLLLLADSGKRADRRSQRPPNRANRHIPANGFLYFVGCSQIIAAFFAADKDVMSSGTIDVGIVMGSQSDWATLRHAAGVLTQLGIAHETGIVSAHRTPDRLYALCQPGPASAASR